LFADLYNGQWTVTVNAKNAIDTTIGSGTNTVVVNPWSIGANVPQVTVTVIPIPGTGNLNITVSWNGDVTVEPALTATLIPHIGTAAALNVVMNSQENGGTITNVNPLANGYYTLTVELRERDGLLVAGGSDIVRIVTGQNTAGAINFGDFINPYFGDFIVNINPQMREPIFLTMSGNLAMILPGDSMTLTVAVNSAATVPAVVGDVVYFWYEKGEYLGTGDTITTPAHTLPDIFGLNQFYRVDVIAYTVDGMRAGHNSFTYIVYLSSDKEITAFSIDGVAGTFSGSESSIINLVMPFGTDMTSLVPMITMTGYILSPDSGIAQDFTNPVQYTVYAEDGSTKIYTVLVWDEWGMYPVADTGQTGSYTSTFGEDSDYVDKPAARNFTANANSTVTDHLTGLVWTKCSLTTVSSSPVMDMTTACTDTHGTGTWESAIQACENLDFAGRTDWRSPGVVELKTIINYGVYNPAIDVSVFPGTASSYYWSSSSYVHNTDIAWIVGFSYGDTDGPVYKTSNYYVRCVAGP
jgi:hypothetical protein